MDTITAINVLIEALHKATRRGAFELVETEPILQAIKFLVDASKTPQNAPGQEFAPKVEESINDQETPVK